MAELNLNEETTINLVWHKGLIVNGYDPDIYRKDYSGAWISRNAYGDRESILGWEIDHVYPISKGGTNEEINLRPINWKNNISKGDSYPSYIAVVTSDENRNIERETHCTVSKSLQIRLNKLYNIK